MEIKFNEVDVAKLNLGPDDVLMVTVKMHPDEMPILSPLAEQLQVAFSQNKVVVLGLGPENEVKFSIVKEPKVQNFCNDCGCGKKEQYESKGN